MKKKQWKKQDLNPPNFFCPVYSFLLMSNKNLSFCFKNNTEGLVNFPKKLQKLEFFH